MCMYVMCGQLDFICSLSFILYVLQLHSQNRACFLLLWSTTKPISFNLITCRFIFIECFSCGCVRVILSITLALTFASTYCNTRVIMQSFYYSFFSSIHSRNKIRYYLHCFKPCLLKVIIRACGWQSTLYSWIHTHTQFCSISIIFKMYLQKLSGQFHPYCDYYCSIYIQKYSYRHMYDVILTWMMFDGTVHVCNAIENVRMLRGYGHSSYVLISWVFIIVFFCANIHIYSQTIFPRIVRLNSLLFHIYIYIQYLYFYRSQIAVCGCNQM